ncbi:MAG: hypothetical protein MP439_11010 [Ferrimicrobium sp.]|jgi:hypothetical protein|nr:hypothetical protein [Ferrimicrobium sp.]
MPDRLRAFGTHDGKRRPYCWRASVERRGAWINSAVISPVEISPDAIGFAGAQCVESGIGDCKMIEIDYAANHDESHVGTSVFVEPCVVAVRS